MAESKKSVYAAIAADAGIAVSKFVAAGFSGSSSMLAEGIHSVIDTGIVARCSWGLTVAKEAGSEASVRLRDGDLLLEQRRFAPALLVWRRMSILQGDLC